MDFEGCSEPRRDRSIVVEEHRMQFRIQNADGEQVLKVRVDGCLINDHRERCDYIFEVGVTCHCAVYVELKGQDVQKAYDQLTSTLECLAARHNRVKRVCHIVASRVPRAGPAVQQLKLTMARKYKVPLHVSTTQASIDIRREPYGR